MINIEVYPLGPLGTNAYLITHQETSQAIVVDPGMHPERLLERIEELDVVAILLTHAHFDHIGGVDAVRKLKQCPVYLHDAEADWLTDANKNGSTRWPELGGPITTAPAEFSLADEQLLELMGVTFQVFHTPGHSPGSVCFLHGDHLIGGDVLFHTGVGRTDLPGGSTMELYHSIHNKLFILPDQVQVYPGHGEKTTIGFEKENNPYV